VTDTLMAPPEPMPSIAGDSRTHRVVLLDPRDDRRGVMRLFLGQCPSVLVVGDAGNLADAEREIREGFADVVLLEIQMPVPEGLATIGLLREHFPAVHVVVCSFHEDPATKEAATAAGADGYIIKPFNARDLQQFFDGLPMPQRSGASATSDAPSTET
jgi:DNA-binding NarL/FixJ family response regulator